MPALSISTLFIAVSDSDSVSCLKGSLPFPMSLQYHTGVSLFTK